MQRSCGRREAGVLPESRGAGGLELSDQREGRRRRGGRGGAGPAEVGSAHGLKDAETGHGCPGTVPSAECTPFPAFHCLSGLGFKREVSLCSRETPFNHCFSSLCEKGVSSHFLNFLLQLLMLLNIFSYSVINCIKNKANLVWVTFL